MLVNGDKLVVTKRVASFLVEGDIVKVIDVNEDGLISFAFGDGFTHRGLMNTVECESHFEKIVEKKAAPTVTQERIDEIMENADIEITTEYGKCTIVSCRLPNGFVIVEYSACVSPENYNEDVGVEICLNKIENKIWELEGYRLQEELYRQGTCEACECEECYCDECPCTESYDEDNGCINTDLECDDCNDYDCPYNTRS